MMIYSYQQVLLVLALSLSLTVSVSAQFPHRTLSTVDTELAIICEKESLPYADAERVRLIHRLPYNLAPEQLEQGINGKYLEPALEWAKNHSEIGIITSPPDTRGNGGFIGLGLTISF